MDSPNKSFSDVVGLVKSWIPRRSEPAHVSKDFWMPDESCRVCYECDSQFTLFNRRHHCRLCGRIFCSKCTSNWIPMLSSEPQTPPEDQDKIRVCNYCFKLWEQGLTGLVENGNEVADLELSSSSPSATSFMSTMSNTFDSSSMTFLSLQKSVSPSTYPSAVAGPLIEKQSTVAALNNDNDVEVGELNLSQDQLNFIPCRSDDDDEEFASCQLSSRKSNYSQVNDYFGNAQFDDIDSDYNSIKAHPDGDSVDSRNMENYPLQSTVSQASVEAQKVLGKAVENDIDDECEAPSSMYVAEDVDLEPVDFENNGVLWLPPEPEDEEDEKEALLFEDDDAADAAGGEWGYSSNSNISESGESKSKEKTNEDPKKGMKSVVDGHFRALVAQLLQVENIPSGDENDKESWLEIITSLSWEAATLLKPDMSKSGQMDPGGYVKVKCLASGCRSESMVVKGVVCKKNVAHRRMTTNIEKPRLFILGGALEYHRVTNALSSFDTLLQQEMDHLKMAVAKIEAHHPDILLVEKSVSRHAQDYLLAENISLVLNIKRTLLERIARCTGSQIVPSIDHLSSPKLGYCGRFHVEKFVEEHGSAGQAAKKMVKTLMYFDDCPKPLGYTILLRGANGDDLKKVKHVMQYGIFAAYHLALETSFLADEGASLPELPVNAPITVALPDKPSKIDRSISTIPGFTVPENEKTPEPQTVGEPHRTVSVPSSELIKLTTPSVPVNEYAKASDISNSMSSQYEPLVSFSSEVFQHSSLNDHSPWHASEETGFEVFYWSPGLKSLDPERLTATRDCHVSSDFGDPNVKILQGDFFDHEHNTSVSLPPSFDINGEQSLEEQPTLIDDFQPIPSDHQSILVSLSSRCVWKGTVCERSHLFRIKYYGNFDKPLGRFLRDHLFDQNCRCPSCEMPAEAHVQCYTHRQGTLTISVKKLAEILLPGEKDGKIWMWHRCLKCPRANGFPPATRRVVMSDAAWGLSFGKFLELSFSNHAAASRVASCGHSLHRDCLRFYGFGNMVACFRYASIDVHSVHLPPSKLEFNYESQEWIQREMEEVASRAELWFSEVLNALRLLVERKSCSSIVVSGINVHQSTHHLADLEVTLHEEKMEFEGYLKNIVNKEAKKGQPAIDILDLNRLRRQLVFRSFVWDHRLIYADSLDKTLQDDMEVSSPESVQKPATTKDLLDVEAPVKTRKSIGGSGSVSTNSKTTKCHKHGLSDQQSSHHNLALHQRINSFFGNDPAGTKTTNESGIVESERTLRRSLSDGQVPFCLTETLDAAWTGENNLGSGNTNNNSVSEIDSGKLPTVGLSEKLDQQDHVEDLSLSRVPSSQNCNTTEESVSWFRMPFMSFYRSLNKSLLGVPQKLDTLSEYDPVFISSFRESELQSGARLLLPVGVSDIVVPVYDDEPTSIISYVLLSDDYVNQLSDEADRQREASDSLFPIQSLDSFHLPPSHSFHEMILESSRSFGPGDEAFLSFTASRSSLPFPSDPLSHTKALHARVSFGVDGPLGQVKYTVTCYFAQRFDTLRRMCCPSEVDFVRSLSRCKKWGAQGGKSNVFFAKTLDDRFIIKQVTKTELESFIKFAPGYFKYISESIASGSPTCLAKILGIYQVASRHQKGGKDSKMDFLVMENLLYGRNVSRLYDLKGSSRSRYNPDTSGSNKVLLDQNLIEAMPTSPIFVGNKAKRTLERAVWNDTAFLASVDVMDYSLLVGVDEEKNELVLGIIDFMRQYTWDKHLETWVKASGILGGPKNASPTVISPKQYKRRFRKAMTTYFLMVPDQWSPPANVPSKSQTDLSEDNHSQTTTPAG